MIMSLELPVKIGADLCKDIDLLNRVNNGELKFCDAIALCGFAFRLGSAHLANITKTIF